MNYNIHPILVHFPIALLFVYSIIKIIPVHRWFPKISWKHTELFLLVCGVISAMAAAATGDTAERLARPNHQLVEMHSTFAGATIWIYALILLGEVLVFLTPVIIPKLKSPKLTSFCVSIQKFLTHPAVAITLAVLGLMALAITGLLGGAMVYGTTADPFVPFVLKILGITL